MTNVNADDWWIAWAMEAHQQGNFTAYDKAIRQPWIILASFIHNSTSSNDNNNGQNSKGQLVCLLPSNITEGSRSYNGSGARVRSTPGVYAAAVAAIIAVLFL